MIAALFAAPLICVALSAGPGAQEAGTDAAARPSIQESLVRPFAFPFREPTSLDRVAAHLRGALSGPVVLDRAALTRLELQPDDTVQLELEGVRLKTGLQLLLDQVGMTFRVVPEDNLLILTDAYGADDPYERILEEIETLHREVHDLRGALDDLYESVAAGGPDGAMRKPTIIEEVPGREPDAQPSGSPSDDAPTETTEPRAVRPGARDIRRDAPSRHVRRDT